MNRIRLRPAAVLVALIACLSAAPAGAAGGDAVRAVERWLTGLAGLLAADGYVLQWGSVAEGAEVSVSDIRSVDTAGIERFRIGRLTLLEPAVGANGAPAASVLVAEDVGASGKIGYTIRRIAIDRPDLGSIGDMLRDQIAIPAGASRRPWTERLNARRLEILDLEAGMPDGGRPVRTSFDRLVATGVSAGRLESLVIDGARQVAEVEPGDRVVTSADRIRAADILIEPAVYAMADDPESLRPLAMLAGIRIGRFDLTGFRSSSTLTGTSEADRLWIRTKAYTPGRSGVLEFGSEGARSRSDEATDMLGPFLAKLFPPRGEVPVDWSGDVSYDTVDGFVGLRQRIAIDGFGSFDFRADIGGLPDLTVAEWEHVAKDDPRLEAMSINGLAFSITDAGGGDRVVLAMADDASVPAKQLRSELAAQVAAIAASLDPGADPRLAAWVGVVEEFVRLGGTLAFAVTKPVPVGAAAGEAEAAESFTEMADRYGLTVTRR